MQIHNNSLIAECPAYNFKKILERKKIRSWLKSMSAFTKTESSNISVNDDAMIVEFRDTHMTWDSQPTHVDDSKHSFVIITNTFREQLHQEWNDKYWNSFGLVTFNGKLTNIGLLFVDYCTIFQSHIFCTCWTRFYYMFCLFYLFNMNKKRSDIVSFLYKVFPFYSQLEKAVLTKKISGLEKVMERKTTYLIF